jgi:hypothetical protein
VNRLNAVIGAWASLGDQSRGASVLYRMPPPLLPQDAAMLRRLPTILGAASITTGIMIISCGMARMHPEMLGSWATWLVGIAAVTCAVKASEHLRRAGSSFAAAQHGSALDEEALIQGWRGLARACAWEIMAAVAFVAAAELA